MGTSTEKIIQSLQAGLLQMDSSALRPEGPASEPDENPPETDSFSLCVFTGGSTPSNITISSQERERVVLAVLLLLQNVPQNRQAPYTEIREAFRPGRAITNTDLARFIEAIDNGIPTFSGVNQSRNTTAARALRTLLLEIQRTSQPQTPPIPALEGDPTPMPLADGERRNRHGVVITAHVGGGWRFPPRHFQQTLRFN